MGLKSLASLLAFPISFFLQGTLDEDVQHVDLFPRLGDVQVAFGIFFRCFVERLSFFVLLFPLFQVLKISSLFFIQH
jgi:hypothetical protein